MIFLKLNEYCAYIDSLPTMSRSIRINAAHIEFYREHTNGACIRIINSDGADFVVKETPDQIDEMIADAATMRNACVISARIKP